MASKSGAPANEESTEDASSELFPGYQNLDHLTKEGFKVFGEAIRTSNALPTGRDFDFYKNFDSFTKITNDDGDRILHMMNSVMKCNEIESNIKHRILEEKTELVIEANDVLLERVAINIDEMNGIRKSVAQPVVMQTVSAQLPVNGSWNQASNAKFSINPTSGQDKTAASTVIKLIAAQNIVRPQKFFKDKVDNSAKYPWQPRITTKPNSLKPLAVFLEEYEDRQEFSHPYECELEKFTPTSEQLLEEVPKPPKTLSDTPLVEITKPEQLDELLETLRSCTEFAVDLEHHSYRSFMGITCLMQISTSDKDYLVDTLSLRDKLEILNEVFTKPSIVKIFHGSDKDVEWLQRDLSLYVVNMFDTHQAAKVLEYSGLSLAYLMRRFCNVLPNKQFQLADWRIRPLPEELKNYAREDTHYLIYIYHMLKQELLAKGKKSDRLLRAVIKRSTEICKKRYFKPVVHYDSHMDLYRKCKKLYDNRQLHALKGLYFWRDRIAREEDESAQYVLPNHMLLQISETLPREMQGILACCSPIPPLVRSNLLDLHQIILTAREQSLIKPILKEDIRARGTTQRISKINIDSPLHCPHDLSKVTEVADNLPTLLGKDVYVNSVLDTKLEIELKTPSYSVFHTPENSDTEHQDHVEQFDRIRGFSFLSPFERYKLVRPFIEAEEAKLTAVKEEPARPETIASSSAQEEPSTTNDRSDEDRIASVRDHFIKLSKQFQDDSEKKKKIEEEREKSLIEMGGTRKRKRERSPCEDSKVGIVKNEIETPMPSFSDNVGNNRALKNSRKRRFDEVWDEDSQARPSQPPKKNKARKNNKNVPKWDPHNPDAHNSHLPYRQRRNARNTRASLFERGLKPTSTAQKKKMKANMKEEKPANFVPYDYSSVDFGEFRGGGGSVRGAGSMNPNHKSKSWKRAGNRGGKANFEGNNNRGGNNSRGNGNRGSRGRGGRGRNRQ